MARDRSNYQRGGKGGARRGQPGADYPNRTDMQQGPRQAPAQATQPVRTPTGLPYGQAGQLADMQRAVPLPQGPPIIPLDAPTQRPNEPITAGMPSGPGPGPEVLPSTEFGPDMDLRAAIAAAFRVSPNDDLKRLLATIDVRQPALSPRPGMASTGGGAPLPPPNTSPATPPPPGGNMMGR